MNGGVQLVASNGETVDLAEPAIMKLPPTGEVGSAYDGDRVFTRFDQWEANWSAEVSEEDFDEMLRRDGKARTLEQVLTLPLRSADWSIDAADGDTGEAEYIRDVLTRPANAGGMTTPIELVIAQMTSAVIMRRAYFEKVFAIDGGRVRYQKLAFRKASTCKLLRDEQDYSFKGFSQRFRKGNDMVDRTIGPEKAFVYFHGMHRDPLHGISDLETAYTVYEAKQKVRYLWYAFLENQVTPKAAAKHDKNDPEEQQALARKVASLKGGGVIGIGPDQSVEVIESGGNGAAEFKEAMRYLDAEQAGTVLAGFTNLTEGTTGSYALSKDQSDFFLRAEQAKLTEMGASLTGWVLADLARYNFGRESAVPVFRFKSLAKEAASEAFEMLKDMSGQANPLVPQEFLDLLVEKVADHLGMNVETIHKAIVNRREQDPTTQLTTGIRRAAELVQEAGVGSQPAPEPAA